MGKNLTPRYLIIALILVWAISTLLPTWRYQRLTEIQKEEMRNKGELESLESKVVRQGLDLKGGMYIVLEADIPTLVANLASIKDERLDNIITKTKQESIKPNLDFFSIFENEVKADGIKLSRYYHEYGASLEDIISALRTEADDAINRVLEILQNRVDQFGVSEPTIQKQGKHRIVVELAGIKNSDRARALLQSTALLEFYLVKNNSVTNDFISQLDDILKRENNDSEKPSKSDSSLTSDTKKSDNTKQVSELFGNDESSKNDSSLTDNVQDLFSNAPFSSLLTALPGDIGIEEKNIYALKRFLENPDIQKKLKNANGQLLLSQEAKSINSNSTEKFYRLYYLEDQPELTGGIVEEARADLGTIGSGSSAGQAIVSLSMNNDGSRTWSRVTGANIGERIAIVLDNKVHMAPSIREKIPSGRTQIEGFANINEAKDLAIILRAGALPAPVKIIEERIVGPSLGTDSITKGTQAVIFGLILILIFMIIYYRLAGTIANFALIWNILLVLAILASLQATLTLPGIAGLILTVGMSIDANVIIFERIREELRKGKTPKAAIDAGYDRAITTIIDANVTTLIASLVLYQFGTGPIKGFATVLFWGILISMFTAVYITRTIFNTYISKTNSTKLSI
ncbi:MAG: protein translocase subunit SecD [Candidatus Marinimicrobia bacterium]|nr:protein translocase subunit SecD [Candidatus Neomarinimicrobiota bacterium]|tara:strand:- start:2225 stop:4117 length:1893 start_codon:yes stop_codon:yes gene_type:complete